MAIVIVGGGAIGLLILSRLAQAANIPPVALLSRPAGAAALRANPLVVSGIGARELSNLTVAGAVDDLPPTFQQPNLAIVCVKGYDTVGAIPTLRSLNPVTILTLQNGIGNEETLATAFGADRIVAGAITTSVDATGPTTITVTKEGGIGLAPVGQASNLTLAEAALSAAGFTVQRYQDYQAMKWSKALLNMLGNATAAILDWPVTRVYANRHLIALERAAVREALAVMRAMGIRPVNLPRYPAALLAFGIRWLPPIILDPILRQRVAGGRGGKDPSLLRDLRAGRSRSEGEFLYGAVAAAATTRGLPAPVNAGLWQVLGGIARGEVAWDDYRGQPERLLAACGMKG
ncbi:ketopantoate reductase family protein [Chloroflexus sp.]|uniref:ketopantoate reductase family protein n=1 Tax=Chloroflexus sp. TaxID=1904827 RepID=UPI002624D282|nr:2-dehydropantoate 2-reductase [uncultured Chloroflexus sp.]